MVTGTSTVDDKGIGRWAVSHSQVTYARSVRTRASVQLERDARRQVQCEEHEEEWVAGERHEPVALVGPLHEHAEQQRAEVQTQEHLRAPIGLLLEHTTPGARSSVACGLWSVARGARAAAALLTCSARRSVCECAAARHQRVQTTAAAAAAAGDALADRSSE